MSPRERDDIATRIHVSNARSWCTCDDSWLLEAAARRAARKNVAAAGVEVGGTQRRNRFTRIPSFLKNLELWANIGATPCARNSFLPMGPPERPIVSRGELRYEQ